MIQGCIPGNFHSRHIYRIPGDGPSLPSIEGIQLRHVFGVQCEIVHHAVRMDTAWCRRLGERDISALTIRSISSVNKPLTHPIWRAQRISTCAGSLRCYQGSYALMGEYHVDGERTFSAILTRTGWSIRPWMRGQYASITMPLR